MTPDEINGVLAEMFADVRASEHLRGRAALEEFVVWGTLAQQLLTELGDEDDGFPVIGDVEETTEE